MRKTAIIFAMLLLGSLFLPILASAADIDVHETSSGETFGTILSNSTGRYRYALDYWSSHGGRYGITTNGTFIWTIEGGPIVDTVHKFDIDGSYISSWNLTGGIHNCRGLTTNGTFIWIVAQSDREVFKYKMDGTYTGDHWDTHATGNDRPAGIATDDNFLWVADSDDAKIYKYNMDGVYQASWDTASSGCDDPRGIATNGSLMWVVNDGSDSEVYEYTVDGVYTNRHWDTSWYANGHPYGITVNDAYLWIVDYNDVRAYKYNILPFFEVTRIIGVATERNDIYSFNPSTNCLGTPILKVPVSEDVTGIIDVTNNSCGGTATEVSWPYELTNNTFCFFNQYVYIGTLNLTTAVTVNWTINCSYGITFNIPVPTYKEVSEDVVMSGRIVNATGVGLNVSVRTHIYNLVGADVVLPVHEWFCSWGNYECTIPTSGLVPGIYYISIELTDPDSGLIFKYGDTLYLSFDAPGDVYSDALVYFNFYNTNVGLGLIPETFQVYINDIRNYENKYYGYTGETINITIKDFYDSVMYTYNHTITQIYDGVNLGLTFHEYFFTNENSEYFYASFLKEGASRWYELVVPSSGGSTSFMLPTGNYTVRVYNADNSSYITWTETVNRSKAYLIGTDGVSLIIQGQSVIVGQFLEMFMPDVVTVCRNPPIVYSVYDKEGMAFGNEFYMICPALITIATTRVEVYDNWINSTPMIPTNGSYLNGTVTIIHDTLYLSGNSTWVNITYTNNGTLFQNTSYVPSRIDIYGQNFTINASYDISVLRIVKYNQVRKFDWTYYPFAGYGPDLDRAGWHSAGVEIINPMPVPIYEVYGIMGFSNESNADGKSVEVRDTDNAGLMMERGPDFDVTDANIHIYLLSVNASSNRAFTLGYYKQSAESYTYDEGTVTIPKYDPTVWNGDSYNTFKIHWTNPFTSIFRGALYVKLNFDVPYGIDIQTMRLWDLTSDSEVDPSLFIPGGEYIRISAQAMGDVPPGSGRGFDAYFLMNEYPGADPTELYLDTPIWMGITLFLIIILIGAAFIILGLYLAVSGKKDRKDYRWLVCVALGIFIICMVIVFQAMGR